MQNCRDLYANLFVIVIFLKLLFSIIGHYDELARSFRHAKQSNDEARAPTYPYTASSRWSPCNSHGLRLAFTYSFASRLAELLF